MKEIKAFIRAERAEEVLDALAEVGIANATLTHVLSWGPHVDPGRGKVSLEFGREVNLMVKLEVICPDQEEDRLLEVARRAACTGQSGDGVISVTTVNRFVKIHDAAESVEAL